MRTLLLYICAFMVMLLMAGCIDQSFVDDSDSPVIEQVDSVAVGFGLSVNNHNGQTRMSYDATQSNENFRGISDFFLIPYAVQGEIGPDDVPLKKNIELGRYVNQSKLISNNNALFYKPVLLPSQTASFLIYGHAPAGTDPFTYGSLSGFENIENQTKTSDITFSLNQIYPGSDIPTIGQSLADYLTSIATIQYVSPTGYYGDIFYRVQRTLTYRWSNPDSFSHSVLQNLFSFISNDDRVMNGSAPSIDRLLTVLYNSLYPIAYSDPTAVSYYSSSNSATPIGTFYPYREMALAIRAAIANPSYVIMNGAGTNVSISLKSPYAFYPVNLNLPDGAAGLQWNQSAQEFQVQIQTKASAKLMSASRFCYPPLLCYYANSRIKTSDADSEEEHYIPSNTWSDILNEYSNSYARVTSKTKAVAIIDAVNYGVSQLRVNLKSPMKLYDRGNVNEITVNGLNFPLTAVIVGPQYDVAYNFDPLLASDDYTVYDKQIKDGSNNPISLLPYNTPTAFAQTLVLPTRKDEVVYLVLEFENNSGVDFNGANGLILDGSKFYMTTKLDPVTASNYDPDDKTKNRVFVQDGYTVITCVVNDLKGAWNVVPDTRDPQLEIGVSMEIKWTHSTTTNVRLD